MGMHTTLLVSNRTALEASITTMVPRAIHDRISELAKRNHKSKAAWMRDVIEDYLLDIGAYPTHDTRGQDQSEVQCQAEKA